MDRCVCLSLRKVELEFRLTIVLYVPTYVCMHTHIVYVFISNVRYRWEVYLVSFYLPDKKLLAIRYTYVMDTDFQSRIILQPEQSNL